MCSSLSQVPVAFSLTSPTRPSTVLICFSTTPRVLVSSCSPSCTRRSKNLPASSSALVYAPRPASQIWRAESLILSASCGSFSGFLSSWSDMRSEEHTSELQSRPHLVCRLLLEKKKKQVNRVLGRQ